MCSALRSAFFLNGKLVRPVFCIFMDFDQIVAFQYLLKRPLLVSCPQIMVRSSDCFTSLQNVVEAAIAPSPGNGNSNATTSAPVTCLSILLDSLSAASDDPVLRRTMITKPNFVVNLANCAIRHIPLMVDERCLLFSFLTLSCSHAFPSFPFRL